MKQISAFLQLIRWQNLFFVALTQALFMYCVVSPIIASNHVLPHLTHFYFSLLAISSVLIAGSGNIINDYFDINIDRINKPEKLVVDKVIKRRWVIVWHLIFSLFGIAISGYISLKTHVKWMFPANFLCVLLLFLYSISLKKKFLSGNILVSLLTAWVILIISFAEFHYSNIPNNRVLFIAMNQRLFRMGVLYASFACIISLVREVIKDMEDMDGDRKYDCRTMPIVWGMNATKVFVAVWLTVLIASLLILQVYVLQYQWWLSSIYGVAFITIPLIYVFKKMLQAQTKKDFHHLSSLVKLIMLTGIGSMIFFKIYQGQ